MLIFETEKGNKAIPITDFDTIQKKNLRSIKNDNMMIKDSEKLSVYTPEIRFKNVCRKNDDGTFDVVIGASIIDEIPTGTLPKLIHKAVHIVPKEQKQGSALLDIFKLSKSGFTDVKLTTVPSKEIISDFNEVLPITEIEKILAELQMKGLNYFG